ncbi:MAG: hypothetical protein ACI4D3_06635 [Lachnospiraceae bacterium]
MRWYDALWVGPGASRHKRRIISSIEKHKPAAGTYLIALAENPSEMFDIVPGKMIERGVYPVETLYILGIAAGKQEAFELVEKMVDYIYRETGTLNIRGYFSE